jgi:hypothetical protein
MINLVSQLIASSSARRTRYVALIAFVVLIAFAAFLGQEPEHG